MTQEKSAYEKLVEEMCHAYKGKYAWSILSLEDKKSVKRGFKNMLSVVLRSIEAGEVVEVCKECRGGKRPTTKQGYVDLDKWCLNCNGKGYTLKDGFKGDV